MYKYNNELYLDKGLLLANVTKNEGTQYPLNILDLWLDEDLLDLGIEKIDVEQYPDVIFYNVGDLQLDGTYKKTQRSIVDIKQKLLNRLSSIGNQKHSLVDWYYIRKSRNGKVVPQNVLDYSALIDQYVDSKQLEIANALTFDDLIVISFTDVPDDFR